MLTRVTLSLKENPHYKKWLILVAVGLVLSGLVIYLYLNVFRSDGENSSPLGNIIKEKTVVEERKLPNPFNGVLIPESEVKEWENRYPVGVMIENLNITRPQTGLSRADIVYEALTEGEITRFMAIYLSEKTDLGPIRSVRLPFLHWALEYDLAVAHVGGSSDALAVLPDLGVKDMDQSRIGEPTFKRVANRGLSLEHTMFSSTEKLWSKAQDLGWKGATVFSSWKFKDDATLENRPTTQSLTMRLTGNLDYIIRWSYDTKTNEYARANGGLPHLDAATQEVIKAKNIIVMYVKTAAQEVSPGKPGRSMQTVGEGDVRIFRDGISVSGKWVKPTAQARTRFIDETGQEIELNRGKIWVEVNPSDNQIEYN